MYKRQVYKRRRKVNPNDKDVQVDFIDEVVRSVREIGQLGFFDPASIDPKFINVDAAAGTVDIDCLLYTSRCV